MKYNIPLASLAAARTLAEGVNAAFTVIPRSLTGSHFCSDLPAASSGRAKRRSGVPPIDRLWLLLTFNGRSHPWDQLNTWRIDDRSSCCWLLGAMSFTSSAKNIWLHVSSSAKSLIKQAQSPGAPRFYGIFAWMVVAQFYSKGSVVSKLVYPAVYLWMDRHCFHLLDQQAVAHRVECLREI